MADCNGGIQGIYFALAVLGIFFGFTLVVLGSNYIYECHRDHKRMLNYIKRQEENGVI